MRRVVLALLALFLLRADMYPDASNATTKALGNLANEAGGAVYPAKAYGSCTWDATSDVGACINAATADAASKGGGKVIVPPGAYGLTQTLTLPSKVRVEGAGGANYGACATTLEWTGAAAGVMAQAGPDAPTQATAGTGLSGMCLDGNALAGTAIKLRFVNWSEFRNLYISAVTANGIDIDIPTSYAGNGGNMFNVFQHNYIDLLNAASITANGILIGPHTPITNMNRSRFEDLVIIHQKGKGIVCGNADSNYFTQAAIESVTPAPDSGFSVDALGHPTQQFQVCRSNIFEGMFGVNNNAYTRFNANADTWPSFNNNVYNDFESGAPPPTAVGAATLWWTSSLGLTRMKALGLGGDPNGVANSLKVYGATSGSVELGVPAVAGTNVLTLPAATGTVLSEPTSAWQDYAPTATCNGGTGTWGTPVGQYKQIGKTMHVSVQLTLTAVGTCTGPIWILSPGAVGASATGEYQFVGRNNTTNAGLVGWIRGAFNGNHVLVWKYDGSTGWANGDQLSLSGTYQLQ